MLFCKVEDPGDIGSVKNSVSSGSEVKGKKETHHDTKDDVKVQKGSFTKISPSAKLLISEHGLDASSLQASGPYGTLLKGDVLAAIKSGKVSSRISSHTEKSPSPCPQTSTAASPGSNLELSDSFEDLPNTQIRKVKFIRENLNLLLIEHTKITSKRIEMVTSQIVQMSDALLSSEAISCAWTKEWDMPEA